MNKKARVDLVTTALIVAQAINPATPKLTVAELKFNALLDFLNIELDESGCGFVRGKSLFLSVEKYDDSTIQIYSTFYTYSPIGRMESFGTVEKVMEYLANRIKKTIKVVERTSDRDTTILHQIIALFEKVEVEASQPKLLTIDWLESIVRDILYTEGEGQRMFKMENRLLNLAYDKFLKQSENDIVAHDVIDYIQASKMRVEPNIRVSIMYEVIERFGEDAKYIFKEIIRDNKIANYRDLVDHFFDWN